MRAMDHTVNFPFHWGKTLDAMTLIAQRLGTVDKVKLTKLLYLIDREHFLRHGVPITGDRLVAMDHGPVPSKCLNALNGDLSSDENRYVLKRLHREDHTFTARDGVTVADALSETERAVIDEVLEKHGPIDQWDLVEELHDLPEFNEAYVKGTSRPITFESILKASGDPRHWRHNRPVLSRETVAAMQAIPADRDL